MSQLLAEITVAETVYRGSKLGLAGEYFWQPFIKRMPSLELGQVEDSGKIGVKFGNLTLHNDFLNAEAPFALQRYEDLCDFPSCTHAPSNGVRLEETCFLVKSFCRRLAKQN